MRIFLYILILCLLPSINFAQQEKQKRPSRTDNFIRMNGVRVGYDLTRPVQQLWSPGNRYGSQLSFDGELTPNFFPTFETGWEIQKINTANVNYRGSGTYSRLGFDYNFLVAEHKQDKDILFMGLRYGFALGKQQVESFTSTSYWEQTKGRFLLQEFNAHWAEIVLGTRIEVVKNIFLGWTMRGKIRLSYKDFEMPPVYFIPGYGKAENSFNFDFSYSVFYNIPVDILQIFRKQEAVSVEGKTKQGSGASVKK